MYITEWGEISTNYNYDEWYLLLYCIKIGHYMIKSQKINIIHAKSLEQCGKLKRRQMSYNIEQLYVLPTICPHSDQFVCTVDLGKKNIDE